MEINTLQSVKVQKFHIFFKIHGAMVIFKTVCFPWTTMYKRKNTTDTVSLEDFKGSKLQISLYNLPALL